MNPLQQLLEQLRRKAELEDDQPVMDVPAALVAYKAALDEHMAVIQRMRASSTEEHVADYLATLQAIRETRATLEATVRKGA